MTTNVIMLSQMKTLETSCFANNETNSRGVDADVVICVDGRV